METSSSPVCNEVDGGGVSIDYPHFSPPGASIPASLSEPLLPLPVTSNQSLSHPLPVYTGQPRPEQFSTSLSALPMSRTGSSMPTTMPSDLVLHSAEHFGSSAVVRGSTNTANDLSSRVQHLETLCSDLQKEKNVMDEQFGQQRKKFMNLMVQKDVELSTVKKSLEKFSNEIKQLRLQLKLKDEEILNTKVATKLTEAANREAFDADRIKYEEEIASLHRIINVERSEREGLGGDLLVNTLASQQRSPSPGDSSLESEMAKAVQESKMLKAVVVPLEAEIDHLRLQLDQARGRLQRIEQTSTPPLIDLDTPIPSEMTNAFSGDVSSTGDGKLQQQLELERSARQDLEMHTKSLEQQKVVLQEEVAALKKCVDDVNEKLAVEQESNQQLKQTWEMANQHFIVAQDQLRQQMYFMQQKQQLLQPPQPSSRGSSPHSPTDVAPGEAHPLPSSAYPIRRSASLGELSEGKGGNVLEMQALESQLKRVIRQLEQRSAMCESYEAQLQRVQEQMLEELDGKDQELSRLREECSKARAGVMRERKAKEELRSKMEEAREHFKIQVEGFQKSMQVQQSQLKALKEQYTQSKHEAQRDLAKFSDERVSLYAHITSAQEEYDCLKVLQAEEAQKFAQHISEEKKERKMVERSLEDLRLRLTELQQEKIAVEEGLGLQLTQLNERLLVEQRDKDNLRRQLEEAKNEISNELPALEQVKEELGQEQQRKEEAMAARTVVEDKSRQFIQEQQQKLEKEAAGRQAAEQRMREMQKQISSLRSQLNTSQENQRDFVQLCQDLQMKLAKIEDEQKCSSPSHPP